MSKCVFAVSQLLSCKSPTAAFSDEATERSDCSLLTGETESEATEALYKIIVFSSGINSPNQLQDVQPALNPRLPPSEAPSQPRTSSLLRRWDTMVLRVTPNRWRPVVSATERIMPTVQELKKQLLAFILGFPDFLLNSVKFNFPGLIHPQSFVNEFFKNSLPQLLVDGIPHGVERHQFEAGDFEGSFIDGRAQGFGIILFKSGDVYCGNFKDGIMDGWGYYRWKHGGEHFGCFSKGVRNGKGFLIYKKFFCAGDFEEDNLEGQGVMWYPDKILYEGEFKNDFPDGTGYLTLPGCRRVKVRFEKGKLVNEDFRKLRDRVGRFISNFRRYGLDALRSTNGELNTLINNR